MVEINLLQDWMHKELCRQPDSNPEHLLSETRRSYRRSTNDITFSFQLYINFHTYYNITQFI